MRARTAQLSLFGVAILIGLLLVGQLRSQQRPVELRSLAPQELSALVQSLSTRNRELQAGLAAQREQLDGYQRAQAEGRSRLELGQQEVLALNAFSGVGAVQGRGIRIEVDGFLDWIAVNDLVNELRNSRAEAIGIDGVRVTGRTVAVPGVDGVVIDGTTIGARFVVSAVGDPEELYAAITGPGGIKDQLEQVTSVTMTLREVDLVVVPATARELAFNVAQPVE
ncbi:MAG TPA: DUF881 domain-containing protein [Candidatus Limnocylindria bacterium]|nr:DUF881 domain-containing protein [Candidatus Limnocylindria bacterium]